MQNRLLFHLLFRHGRGRLCPYVETYNQKLLPLCRVPPAMSDNDKGECISGVSGSKSVAGKRTVYVGTWENRIAPNGSCQGAEKATKQYGVSVVGLTHSRGVGRVMPVESRYTRHSKGSALIRKDGAGHSPDTELEVTMETLQRLISEIAIWHSMFHETIEVSINEEPDEGNLQVRFCEGHASPYTEFIKTQSLLN